MSLQSRISEFITALGVDIKDLQSRSNDRRAASFANQTLTNGDTYIVGSAIAIPADKVKAGTTYRCKFNVVKTGAGAAAPAINVRVGVNGSIADTSRGAFSFAAQTAVIDEGVIEIEAVFRSNAATAFVQVVGRMWHRLVTTGLSVTAVFTQFLNTGGTFDVRGAGLIMGVSINVGASSSWTVSVVTTELTNLVP